MRQTIRFGPYTIDPDQFVLRKHNVRLKLQRQPFKLLLLLIRRRGTVVDRGAMIQELWGDGTQVDFDRSLNFCISQIRTVLNDDSTEPKYIETVHREGYRFLSKVEWMEAEPTAPAKEPEARPAEAPNRRRFAIRAAAGAAGVAGAGLLWSRFAGRRSAAPRPPVRLTGLAGWLTGPAFSPDDKQVAFGWSREGRSEKGEIHVKMVGGAETLQLTSGEALDGFPRWTPDGKAVVFCREQGEDAALWQAPALGGTPKRIASLGDTPLYSFAFRRPFDVLPSGGFLASVRIQGRSWRIVRIGEQGEDRGGVTSPPKFHYDHHPAVSPDGRRFAFLRSEHGNRRELHVQSLEGGESKRISPAAWVSSMAWTRDGRALLLAGTLREAMGIWIIPAEGGEPRLVHGSSSTLRDVSLSSQGDQALFVEANQRNDLWQASLNTTNEARPLIASARIHDSPRLSPDGRRLAFYTDRTGPMQVWIANADGSGAHALTNGLYPAWSPDGKRLAFVQAQGLYTIGVDGGMPETVLADGIGVTRPAWSADGQWIYFESARGGGLDIWKIATAPGPGRPQRVTKSGGVGAQFFGGHVYYRKRGAGTMRTGPDGGEEERMAPEGTAFAVMPGAIYVLTVDRELLRIDHRTREVQRVRRLDRASGGSSIAISPDEKHVVYAYQSDAGHEIMLARDVDWRL